MKVFAILLALIMLAAGCSAPLSRRTVCDYKVGQLTFRGIASDHSQDTTRYYKGQIDGEAAQELYVLIKEQYAQPELSGGNYEPSCPQLTVTAPDGMEFSCGYTYDRIEYSSTDPYDEIDPGMPVECIVGECFVISGASSRKFQITSAEARERFDSLVSEYLRENGECSPKRAENGNILLIQRITNYAWEKEDNGSFLDDLGNLYLFDFSDRSFASDEEFLTVLNELYISHEPMAHVAAWKNERGVEILRLIDGIDPQAELQEKSRGADMGQRSLYALSGESLILLRSHGDWERNLDDNSAKDLCVVFDMMANSY